MREVLLDSPPKKREPLNPAYAILVAAILSAGTAITATYLNIRSSERLQRERDRTDAAKKESDDLKGQLTALQTKLNETSNAVNALAETSDSPTTTTPLSPGAVSSTVPVAAVPATAAALPSIIVVLPSNPPTVLTVTPTTNAEPKVEPKPETRAEAPTNPPPTQAVTTTTLSPTTVPSSSVLAPTTTPGPVAAAAALPSTPSTTKLP